MRNKSLNNVALNVKIRSLKTRVAGPDQTFKKKLDPDPS